MPLLVNRIRTIERTPQRARTEEALLPVLAVIKDYIPSENSVIVGAPPGTFNKAIENKKYPLSYRIDVSEGLGLQIGDLVKITFLNRNYGSGYAELADGVKTETAMMYSPIKGRWGVA